MALNYSHLPIFPAHISEDSLTSPTRIVNRYLVEGAPMKNGEGFTRTRHWGRGETEERNYNCGRDGIDWCRSPNSTAGDIVDLLPSDPFGMDIKTTFTAITGWLEDLDVNYGVYVRNNYRALSEDDYNWFASWNLIWNNATKFPHQSCNAEFDEKLNMGVQSFLSNLRR